MVGHNAMANPAKRCEIAHLFVEEVCVGAVMNFEGAARAVVVADPAAEARGFKLGEPGRVLAPTVACDISIVGHLIVPISSTLCYRSRRLTGKMQQIRLQNDSEMSNMINECRKISINGRRRTSSGQPADYWESTKPPWLKKLVLLGKPY